MAAFLIDRFVSNEEVKLPVADLSMQRAYAIFDFLRTVNDQPLFLEDHLNRFYTSAAAMHLPVKQNREELTAILHELIQRSSLPEAGIRIMLTGGISPDTYQPAEPNLVITCNPVKTATEEDFEKGISIITYKHQRELPHIKSISYLTAVWLQPLLKEKKVNDALYYNENSITEFPRCNVFVVTKDKQLVTPAYNMLKGITRKQVLEIAADHLSTAERDIPVSTLTEAAEIFLTATTKKIIPVVKVNDMVIGNGKPGPVTRKLYEQFLLLERSAAQRVSR